MNEILKAFPNARIMKPGELEALPNQSEKMLQPEVRLGVKTMFDNDPTLVKKIHDAKNSMEKFRICLDALGNPHLDVSKFKFLKEDKCLKN